ncbi:MAG: DNA recombination protein RmuC [Micavibrio sp.]|nr:DNA recombination protein RmuC [Micavibrio sp.]MBK9562273.1 DNA recombination protein RmuC [Micavibrio sp.]
MDVTSAIIGLILGAIPTAILLYKLASTKTRLEENSERLEKLQQENITLNENFRNIRDNEIKLQTEKNSFEEQVKAQKESFKKIEEDLLHKFENLSSKIYGTQSDKFKTQSAETLSLLLNPLKEKLVDFQKKIDDSFGEQAKEQRSLKDQIENIVLATQKVHMQAEGLTNALRREGKTRGNWGEVVLEQMLEDAGLRKDENYIVQGANLNLVHPEKGTKQKPDIVVKLPEGKHIVIDSKVSLIHYEQYCNEKDMEIKAAHLKQFLNAVRTQVEELEDSRYQDTAGLGTPQIVLMFMPIESAYVLAMEEDKNLHKFAWDKNVAIVCHSTLFSTLRTVASLWKLTKQNQNTLKIAQEGGALYDKIEGFVQDMQAMGRQLKTVETTYDKAMNKLSTGRGNILSKAENLKTLGAKTSKSLPMGLIESDNDSSFEQKDAEASENDRQTGT